MLSDLLNGGLQGILTMIILLIASTLILASGIFSIVHSILFDLDNKSQYLLILDQILNMIQLLLQYFTHFIN